jgi:predicted DCC family thiol-disulfide oxidoreductase YuxK
VLIPVFKADNRRRFAYDYLMPAPRFLVLFDGTCNFCNGSVRFIMKRDRRERFAFLSSQTNEGRALAAKHGFAGPTPGSMILIDRGADGEASAKVFSRSTASLEIVRRLDGLWPILYAFILIPRPIRDAVYKWFAARRHRCKADQCVILPANRRGDHPS